MVTLPTPPNFVWDKGNEAKNLVKHGVTDDECEQVFFDPLKHIIKDELYSEKEERYIILGHTKQIRLLFIAFTIRPGGIRIISARNVNKKERNRYEEKTSSAKIQERG